MRTDAIRLEAATICQLACPLCPTPTGEIKAAIGAGFLRLDAFRRIVDENPAVARIELSNWGEIFLNPDIEAITEYAYRRSVALTAWNGANLNHVRESALEALARWRFRGITCSIDGVTQETYAAYRRKGDVRRVLDTIRRLNDYKRRWKTEYLRLRWQMVWFEHNAHEVDAARALAADLGMTFHLKANWAAPPSSTAVAEPPLRQAAGDAMVAASSATTAASAATASAPPAAPASDHGEDLSAHYCQQLWNEPQLNFDGRLLGCCVNTWGTFGPNAFEVGLARALGEGTLEHAKRMLEGRAPARADVPCSTCDIYVERARTGAWLRDVPARGLAPFLRRHGMGRVVVWIANRFERPLLPVLRAIGMADPLPRGDARLASPAVPTQPRSRRSR
jgi:hypothetical protein